MMDFDPHTLQLILQRIWQQMRCPQCGRKVQVDFSTVRLVTDGSLLLQLKCHDCNAHIVLQASVSGVESVSAPPYESDARVNASSSLEGDSADVEKLRQQLQTANGSFEKLFKKDQQSGPSIA